METFSVLVLECFFLYNYDVLRYFADIFRTKRMVHCLFNVELTDFAVICAVIFITKRVSKFMQCFI